MQSLMHTCKRLQAPAAAEAAPSEPSAPPHLRAAGAELWGHSCSAEAAFKDAKWEIKATRKTNKADWRKSPDPKQIKHDVWIGEFSLINTWLNTQD